MTRLGSNIRRRMPTSLPQRNEYLLILSRKLINIDLLMKYATDTRTSSYQHKMNKGELSQEKQKDNLLPNARRTLTEK